MDHTPVLIAGGGPVGLMLAAELDNRGIDAILVERNPTTTQHPKMDITNGRSMELFRRLGVIDDLRAAAVPEDHVMSVVWVDDFGSPELARFDYPSVADTRKALRQQNDGTTTSEPSMRISQVLLEPVLKSFLERECERIDVRFGWALDSFEQDDDGVTSTIRNSETGETQQIRSDYLAGCDGGGSIVRRQLGIPLGSLELDDVAAAGFDRDNLLDTPIGKMEERVRPEPEMMMIHFHSNDPGIYELLGSVWHYQSVAGWGIISQNDKDTWTIHISIPLVPDYATKDPKQILFDLFGREFDCEVLVANPWKPNLALADSYGSGRVWLAGDSVHQVIPTGGYGMNSGMGDALALGWVLAANVQGWGGPELFQAYEAERRHVGARVRIGSVFHAGLRFQIAFGFDPLIGEDSDAGRAKREEYGQSILDLGNLENEAWGLEHGYRYDASPVICHEDGDAPPYTWERAEPTTWPGVRAPHVFLPSGASIHDLFGVGFTLLSFGPDPAETEAATETFVAAAEQRGIPFDVVHIDDEHAASIYERSLVLVRPDQHVAWRGEPGSLDAGDGTGSLAAEVGAILDRVCGLVTADA